MGHPTTPAITPRQWYDYFKGLLAQPLAPLPSHESSGHTQPLPANNPPIHFFCFFLTKTAYSFLSSSSTNPYPQTTHPSIRNRMRSALRPVGISASCARFSLPSCIQMSLYSPLLAYSAFSDPSRSI
jgi:hypothetical protein